MKKSIVVFENRYLKAVRDEKNEDKDLFFIEIVDLFPNFFVFPILDISAQILVYFSEFYFSIPNNSSILSLFESVGYKFNAIESRYTQLKISADDLKHVIPYKAKEYLFFSTLQERFYYGLSQSSWSSANIDEQLLSFQQSIFIERKLDHFSDLIENRRSAINFKKHESLSKSIIDAILRDCYYLNRDGKTRVATAGGFNHFELYYSTSGSNDIDAGYYRIKTTSTDWELLNKNSYTRAIWDSVFHQDYFEDCSDYFIFVLNLDEMIEKYGSRSHRFSFIGLGGMLDRFHLSCTSYGLSYRTIGGFDEVLLKKVLGIEGDSKIIGAIGAIGT